MLKAQFTGESTATTPRVAFGLCAFLAGLACACSSDDDTPRRERPAGPAADVSQEITGGNGPFIGAAPGGTMPSGYVEHEYVASGTATAYVAQGPLSMDGKWTFEPGTTAAYRTRVLVRRPADAGDFSGTVIVEWLNVSGGLDANPDYASLEEEITRQGHAWVGVSAQLIGVAGGTVLVTTPVGGDLVGKGLKALDPARYSSLEHPGDGYSFDIFTQVARAAAGGQLLGGTKPRVVLAAGESQSAIALTTYYNGVQPSTRAFDGFLVHSRASVSLPLVEPGKPADLATAITTTGPALLRDDLDAPVLELQAESDVIGILNSYAVRQPDSDRFRLWEVAGTAHADAHLLGSIASSIDCGAPINDGPMHLVAKAALRHLDEWVRSDAAPPTGARLEVATNPDPAIVRDADDIALGGIRTPPVEVPVDALSGVAGPKADLLCLLLGSSVPLPEPRLTALYPSRATYEQQYAAEAGRTIEAGFVLEEDRAALLGFSKPSRIVGR
ncbi:MAG TPA: alpha/beta hydrolase domain-containing protein [Polyangiaceae bacterium]